MKNFESLKKNKDFSRVYSLKRSRANKYLVMYIRNNDKDENRLGISVSKKIGNSVVRHRITRLIRESYRLNQEMFNSGLDIVIVARPAARGRNFYEIRDAVIHLGRMHSIIK